jgi:hypothetical protein
VSTSGVDLAPAIRADTGTAPASVFLALMLIAAPVPPLALLFVPHWVWHWLAVHWGDVVPAWLAVIFAAMFGFQSWRSSRRSKAAEDAAKKQADGATDAAEEAVAAQKQIAGRNKEIGGRRPRAIGRRRTAPVGH